MRRNEHKKQGSTIIEFALIIPLVLVPLLAGIWDISRVIDINQILTRAARDGVVLASRGNDPVSPVQDYIEAAGLNAANLTVTVSEGAAEQGYGQEVSVILSYDFTGTTMLPWETLMPDGISRVAYARME